MKDLGNRFLEESKDLLTLDTKLIAHPSAAELLGLTLRKVKLPSKTISMV